MDGERMGLKNQQHVAKQIKGQKLPAGAKLVLMALALRCNDNDFQCNPSVSTVAADTGLSTRTVQRHIALLRTMGLIATFAERAHTSNHYCFSAPGIGVYKRLAQQLSGALKWVQADAQAGVSRKVRDDSFLERCKVGGTKADLKTELAEALRENLRLRNQLKDLERERASHAPPPGALPVTPSEEGGGDNHDTMNATAASPRGVSLVAVQQNSLEQNKELRRAGSVASLPPGASQEKTSGNDSKADARGYTRGTDPDEPAVDRSRSLRSPLARQQPVRVINADGLTDEEREEQKRRNAAEFAALRKRLGR
jgi:hypothetical protein